MSWDRSATSVGSSLQRNQRTTPAPRTCTRSATRAPWNSWSARHRPTRWAIMPKARTHRLTTRNKRMDDDQISPEWIKAITLEHRQRVKDENTIHNKILHQYILDTWQRDSPRMWARLLQANLTERLAYVLQQRMWDRAKELRQGGMSVTDAREIAEREELILEPEESAEESSDMWTPDLSTLNCSSR